ncbi:MAG TPA: hypothetical protein VK501_05470 [Baekduia sp.]|uniref:hypothetical protein n=1 Tax=Baekduia sp. TaxID=2600305 RepID=UPI002CD44C80|nr:hypothetical protein [Baekduia sp.]HMJ33348.1 hypothetical protein [Baekduia sp.]
MLITLHPSDLDPLRVMLREQLAGDYELLRDLQAGARTATPEVYGEAPTRRRVALVEHLAKQIGGLY